MAICWFFNLMTRQSCRGPQHCQLVWVQNAHFRTRLDLWVCIQFGSCMKQNFPVHIETLAPPKTILLYATGTRDGGKPVLAPMIETFFLERLCGHSLGSYGISVGPVTLTTYQRILMSKTFSMGKLVTSIICHRMLMECYLNADIDMVDDGWPPEKALLSEAAILPHRH